MVSLSNLVILSVVVDMSRSSINSVKDGALGTKGEVLFVLLGKFEVLHRGEEKSILYESS